MISSIDSHGADLEPIWNGSLDREGRCFSLVTYTGPSSLAEAMEHRARNCGLSKLIKVDKNRARVKARQRMFNPTFSQQRESA